MTKLLSPSATLYLLLTMDKSISCVSQTNISPNIFEVQSAMEIMQLVSFTFCTPRLHKLSDAHRPHERQGDFLAFCAVYSPNALGELLNKAASQLCGCLGSTCQLITSQQYRSGMR